MKLTRRQMLQVSAAATVAGVAIRTTAFSGGALKSKVIAVVDARLPESVHFGSQAASRGAQVIAVEHDLAEAWLPISTLAAMPVLIGLTRESTLFCLDIMTRAQGSRLMHLEELSLADPHSMQSTANRVLASVNRSGKAHSRRLGPAGLGAAKDDPSMFVWALAPRASMSKGASA